MKLRTDDERSIWGKVYAAAVHRGDGRRPDLVADAAVIDYRRRAKHDNAPGTLAEVAERGPKCVCSGYSKTAVVVGDTCPAHPAGSAPWTEARGVYQELPFCTCASCDNRDVACPVHGNRDAACPVGLACMVRE